MIWNSDIETLSQQDLEQLQIERLQSTINRVYINVPYYQKVLNERGLKPGFIKNLSDIKKLPFTSKEILRNNYPYGMFAVPLREVVRIQGSSGTTGSRIITGYTRNDISNWTELNARTLTAMGITKDDLVQISLHFDLFTGGFGFNYGAERISASVIPAGSGNPDGQLTIMKDYKTTVLISTPSFVLTLIDRFKAGYYSKAEFSLEKIILGAEPWSENTRNVIESSIGAKVYDSYGLSEIIGPGVSFECEERSGLHINEDHFIAEIIDPATLDVLDYGNEGELVLTAITREAYPMIRFRTGDITTLYREKCSCGRNFIKMKKIITRCDDMIIVNGNKVYPYQIEEIISKTDKGIHNFQVITERNSTGDTMEVLLEFVSARDFDEIKSLQDTTRKIEKEILRVYNIEASVRFVEKSSLYKKGHKTPRYIDKRNI